MKGHKFVESARAFVAGGSGGNGCASFRREKFVPHGGPDGGDGGRGGHVIIQADQNINSLISVYYRPHQRAQNGGHGKGKNMHGRNGKDTVLKVPCGTEIRDEETNTRLGDLVTDGTQLTIAQGGQGGQGNSHWKRGSDRSPGECTQGEPGEHKTIRLDLKTVADAGLIGLPNAGKSTLLSVISNAHPKIAPYPFTTLHPVIGTVKYKTFTDLTVVDIPGLIKGAYQGAGLGHKFLRHVERAQLLVFVIDMAGADGRNPAEDYFVLLNELSLHNHDLVKRPFLVVANKMDLPEAQEQLPEFEQKTGQTPLLVSSTARQGIDELKQALYSAAGKHTSAPRPTQSAAFRNQSAY